MRRHSARPNWLGAPLSAGRGRRRQAARSRSDESPLKMRRVHLATAIVLVYAGSALSPAHIHAQAIAPTSDSVLVRRDDRVRLSSSLVTNPSLTGRILRLRGDSLFIRLESTGTDLGLPVAALTRLDVQAGARARQRNVRIGAVTGLAIALAVGVPMLRASENGLAVPFATLGTISGTVLGAGIGWAVQTPRWVPGRIAAPRQ